MRVLILLLLFVVGCGSGSGGGGSAPAPTFCKAYTLKHIVTNVSFAPITTNQFSVSFNLNSEELADLKAFDQGCSQSYKIAIVDGEHFFISTADSIKPTVIEGWDDVGSNLSFSYSNVYVPSGKGSACVKAISNLNEESSWICQPQTTSSVTSPTISTPTTPTSSTDSTAPSQPSNLKYSITWQYSSSISFSWSSSYDAESGIKQYRHAIFDSNLNQLTAEKTSASTSEYISVSSLPSGKSYYFAVIAENGGGLMSQVTMVSFYKPMNVTVSFRYEAMGNGSCYNYPSSSVCVSTAKTMLDIQLVKLKQDTYPNCTLNSLGGNTYQIDCYAYQNCTTVPIGEYCGGTPKTVYNPSCKPITGIYYYSSSCQLWSPAIPYM